MSDRGRGRGGQGGGQRGGQGGGRGGGQGAGQRGGQGGSHRGGQEGGQRGGQRGGQGGGQGGGQRGGQGGGQGEGYQGGGRGSSRGDRGYSGGERGGRGGGRGRGGEGHEGQPSQPKGDVLFKRGEAVPDPDPNVTKIEDALMKNSGPLSLSNLSLKGSTSMPPRPGYAKKGTPIILRSNYFELQPIKNLLLYRYEILVFDHGTKETKQVEQRRKLKQAIQMLVSDCPIIKEALPAVASDYSKIIITAKKLKIPDGETREEVVVFENEGQSPSPRGFRFKIRFNQAIGIQQLMDYIRSTDLGTSADAHGDILQALNIVMTRVASSSGQVTTAGSNTKFYPVNAVVALLGGSLVALRGYYSSVKAAPGRLLLNVNSITGTFYQEGPLRDRIQEFSRGPPDYRALNKFLRGVRVQMIHLPKTIKSIWSLEAGFKNANEASFNWAESKSGNPTTVFNYFKRKYSRTLKYPNEVLINVGNGQNPILVPQELCIILPGQPAGKKLDPRQTDIMTERACRDPADNARLIVGEGVDTLGLGTNQVDGPSIFGLNIIPEMITVLGRLLGPPQVQYDLKNSKNKKPIIPSLGSWNMINVVFNEGANVRSWTYFEITYAGDRGLGQERLTACVKALHTVMRASGLRVQPPAPGPASVTVNRATKDEPDPFTKVIDSVMGKAREKGIDLLFIVLPDKGAALYDRIKFSGDVKFGIHTICSIAEKLSPRDPNKDNTQYLANIALKFNLKLGGRNQQLAPMGNPMGRLAKGDTMVVGIDVTHPSPGSLKKSPSIAGMVASIDPLYSQWPASLRAQEGRKEMVDDIKEMMEERIQAWQAANKKTILKNVLIYRDGVGEGQYNQVLEIELKGIEDAVRRFYPPKAVAITIVIVGKRHHTRFYPTSIADVSFVNPPNHTRWKKENGNPKPGTVVDRGVTSARFWDFYLQAHHGLQGTARPAHYVVLKDDMKFTADELEGLTHNLCYLFGRATKAVSICPPAYYADLACERGRCYLRDAFNPDDNMSVSGSGASEFNWSRMQWSRDVHANLKNTMFYL